MPIEFSFSVGKNFDFAQAFADRFQQPIMQQQVELPASLGEGHIREVHLDDNISLCIHQYHLKESLILNRLESDSNGMLTIKFTKTGFFSDDDQPHNSVSYQASHMVEVSTGNLFTRSVLPENSAVNFLVINISRQTLTGLLQLDDSSPMQVILLRNPSFVFYESMSSSMENPLLQILQTDSETAVSKLQYQSCVYRLLFLLFHQLLNRERLQPMQVNPADAEKIHDLQNRITSNLSTPPELPRLAQSIGMSETKMKKLFRYIFGKSIYNYYQEARMNEAAQLLLNHSVSEVGYRLGFTNLSHFARLFQKQFHIKPRQYQTLALPRLKKVRG